MRNATPFGVTVVSPWKLALIIAQTACLRYRVRVCVQRRTGQWVNASGARCFCKPLCRCARNCFMCPNCRNTLSVVPSDPPDSGDGRLAIPISIVGEPPFFLYCNHCRWDSAEVGITFEKPTGLAGQYHIFGATSKVSYYSLHVQLNCRNSKTLPPIHWSLIV